MLLLARRASGAGRWIRSRPVAAPGALWQQDTGSNTALPKMFSTRAVDDGPQEQQCSCWT